MKVLNVLLIIGLVFGPVPPAQATKECIWHRSLGEPGDDERTYQLLLQAEAVAKPVTTESKAKAVEWAMQSLKNVFKSFADIEWKRPYDMVEMAYWLYFRRNGLDVDKLFENAMGVKIVSCRYELYGAEAEALDKLQDFVNWWMEPSRPQTQTLGPQRKQNPARSLYRSDWTLRESRTYNDFGSCLFAHYLSYHRVYPKEWFYQKNSLGVSKVTVEAPLIGNRRIDLEITWSPPTRKITDDLRHLFRDKYNIPYEDEDSWLGLFVVSFPTPLTAGELWPKLKRFDVDGVGVSEVHLTVEPQLEAEIAADHCGNYVKKKVLHGFVQTFGPGQNEAPWFDFVFKTDLNIFQTGNYKFSGRSRRLELKGAGR